VEVLRARQYHQNLMVKVRKVVATLLHLARNFENAKTIGVRFDLISLL
jgi:hypothetical protein